MAQDTTENSPAPPIRHHGFKMARRVCDTYEMCTSFIFLYECSEFLQYAFF